jgi:hypothetical protein
MEEVDLSDEMIAAAMANGPSPGGFATRQGDQRV